MMHFKKHDGSDIYLAPEYITCVEYEDSKYSRITTSDRYTYLVEGLAEKIAIKVSQEKRRS